MVNIHSRATVQTEGMLITSVYMANQALADIAKTTQTTTIWILIQMTQMTTKRRAMAHAMTLTSEHDGSSGRESSDCSDCSDDDRDNDSSDCGEEDNVGDSDDSSNDDSSSDDSVSDEENDVERKSQRYTERHMPPASGNARQNGRPPK